MTPCEMKEKYLGAFGAGDVRQLEEAERLLMHPARFDSDDALALGCAVAACAKAYPEEIAVRISRVEDGLAVFQYAGNTKKQRNFNFAEAKARTVLKTGHCSLWALAAACAGVDADASLREVFAPDSGCLPVGGAFPVYVGDALAAVIAVSGLHEGKDHEAVIRGLARWQGLPVPAYDGVLL